MILLIYIFYNNTIRVFLTTFVIMQNIDFGSKLYDLLLIILACRYSESTKDKGYVCKY